MEFRIILMEDVCGVKVVVEVGRSCIGIIRLECMCEGCIFFLILFGVGGVVG